MKKNTQEKLLVQVNENSIFYKIKKFFRNIFNSNTITTNNNGAIAEVKSSVERENKKNSFMESIRNIEDEETKLLKLQQQYRNGEIKEEELTEEQKYSLCSLYDKQIANLKRSNELREQRLLEYRKRLPQ